MAFRIRPLAAGAAVLMPALVTGPAPSSLAATGSAELPVTLTIYDICTLDTTAHQPAVACSAGGQYRILTGEYFANFRVAELKPGRGGNASVVEIAF
ncbi:hypothetical protein [Caballeronia insecticola]|uniref:Lipoprotein n=1 Tax=Caballeronia insecticola TaxID=758793 RepID=R4WRK2_9BURK|nr:hypothetical protein [Caballeronia insecticola]BAN27258.1 hypothetical protein BRPE64_DCDS03220 [Caballeronia insecticola]